MEMKRADASMEKLGLANQSLAAATGRVVPGFFAHLFFNLAIFGPFALVHLSD